MSMDGKHRSFQEQVEKQPDYRYDVRNEIIINNDTMIFEEEYNVKVLMLNGSAKANGNTYASLLEVGRQLEKEGIEYEIFQMGGEPVRDCLGCGQCTENGCVFADDKVNEFVAKAICIWYTGVLCTSKWKSDVLPGPGILQQRKCCIRI